MQIEKELFEQWIADNFDPYVIAGDEVKINDPWWEAGDTDHKLWINTDKLCYRAFKSGRTGHLIQFVMEIEKCDWSDAVELMGGDDSLVGLEQQLIKFLNNENNQVKPTELKKGILPPDTYLISELPNYDPLKQDAIAFLTGRQIDITNLMVCKSGRYTNRILIPYYDQQRKLIYFNTRALTDKAIRYLGPEKEDFGTGKGDVLWMGKWAKEGSKIYITEGEFDAMSLIKCGLYAGACGGKDLSSKQIEMIKNYRIVMSFDADKAGRDSFKIAEELLEYGISEVSLIRPCMGVKDWNAMLIKYGSNSIRKYIEKEEKLVNSDTITKMKFEEI